MDFESVLKQDGLTDEQRAAIMDNHKEILTLACAGSGKSTTLAYRIARLLVEGEPPKSILAFTFTEKAAEAIKLRVAHALHRVGFSPTVLGAMYIGTMHSYCYHLLKSMDAAYRQFEVLDDNRFILYLLSRYRHLSLHLLQNSRRSKQFETIRKVADAWKTVNDELIAFEDVLKHDHELGQVLINLRSSLNRDRFIDFSLMIRLTVEALEENDPRILETIQDLRHVLVDEYQDVNPAQEMLVRNLHKHSETLFAVGDDDQAIYAWRGADVRQILRFEERYPGCSVHTLSRNFRSTEAIVQAASDFIQAELGPNRRPKMPQASNPEGPRDFRKLWFASREEEARWVVDRIQELLDTEIIERNGTRRGLSPADFAILMRSVKGGRKEKDAPRHEPFTRELMKRGIPFTIEQGGGLFARPQVRALLSTFRLFRHHRVDRPMARILFETEIKPVYPNADFDRFAAVLARWHRMIYDPPQVRRRVYPQQLVYDLLEAFGLPSTDLDEATMRDIGSFSKIIQDVETVYVSIDSPTRFHEMLNFLDNVAVHGYDSGTDDVLLRPDAVTISTVHKAKGLEFPVVFIVDVEHDRFPTRERNYDGWLPTQIIRPALSRGAYRSTRDEEARLFYTALTRAERYLYITGSEWVPGGKRPRRPSTYFFRLSDKELQTEKTGLPQGSPRRRSRRIQDTVMPTTFSDIQYYLRCPRDYRFRKSFRFSPPIVDLFGYGLVIHSIIGKLHEKFRHRAPTETETSEIVDQTFHLKHVPPSKNPDTSPGPYERAKESARDIVKRYVSDYAVDFQHSRQLETRFELPIKDAVISGNIDLLIRMKDDEIISVEVIDFKTMEGGDEPSENREVEWTELALQVQLYAKAAQDVLGENARTGAVHLLKDGTRTTVPIHKEAIDAAIANMEWAVRQILKTNFPMRPHSIKCAKCDFRSICPKVPEEFGADDVPPPVCLPNGQREMVPAFRLFEKNRAT